MADLKVIAETLVNLTVKEVNELATILKGSTELSRLLQLLLLLLPLQVVLLLRQLRRRPLSMLFSRAQVLTSSRLLRPLRSKPVLA